MDFAQIAFRIPDKNRDGILYRNRRKKNEHVLLTRDEFVAIAGRECNGERDFIGVYSGDRKGIETYPVSASCNKEDGNVYVKFTDRNDGRGVRVTYLIVLGF